MSDNYLVYIPNRKRSKIQHVVLGVTIISYLLFLICYYKIDRQTDLVEQQRYIFLNSWLGIITFGYILITWRKITGKFIDLYTIFMLFIMLFNFGQCIMWAFGIHMPKEIGKTTLYTLGIPTKGDIIITQILTLTSMLALHCGAVFCYKGRRVRRLVDSSKKVIPNLNDIITLKSIYNVSKLLAIIVIPLTLYISFKDLIIARQHGYAALYYGDYTNNTSSILVLLSKMFFPCLIGILIGSKYRKRDRYIVYSIFIVNLSVNLLCGDRGSWIYQLIILFYMSHTYYKRFKLKNFILYGVIGIVALYLLTAIVSIRNNGINIENIIEALSFENSPIVDTIFEMGATMRVNIVMIKYGEGVWPYGNTYLIGIISMISTKVYRMFIPGYSSISDWFSQGFLGISYGAGFSLIAEAIVNVGIIMVPIILMVLGSIVASFIYTNPTVDYKIKPLKAFFAITTMNSFISLARNNFHGTLKSWLYSTVVICIIIIIYRAFLFKKYGNDKV